MIIGIAGTRRITQRGPGDFNWLNNHPRAFPGSPPLQVPGHLPQAGVPAAPTPPPDRDDVLTDRSFDPFATPPHPNVNLPTDGDQNHQTPDLDFNTPPLSPLQALVHLPQDVVQGAPGAPAPPAPPAPAPTPPPDRDDLSVLTDPSIPSFSTSILDTPPRPRPNDVRLPDNGHPDMDTISTSTQARLKHLQNIGLYASTDDLMHDY